MDIHARSLAAGYCKLKTARQKKRLQKEDHDKQLIRLHRRQQELALIKRALPPVPLAVPYQKGWKRIFVLRDDMGRSKQADFYTALLPKINTVNYATEKHFRRKLKRRKNLKRQYEVIPQSLRELSVWEWQHRNKLTEEEKAHFYPKTYWSKDGKTQSVYYVFTEPWRYVLQIRPNMITHATMLDEVLEQEIQEAVNYIRNHYLRPRMTQLVYGRSGPPGLALYRKRKIQESFKKQTASPHTGRSSK